MNRKTKKLINKLRKGKYKEKLEAANELGKTGDVEAIEPLSETLTKALEEMDTNSDLEVLGVTAAKSLTQLGVDHTDTLIKSLDSYNPVAASKAATALGELKRQDAIEYLLAKVSHREPLIRSQVVWALGEVGRGDKKVEETLRNVVASDSDGYVRRRAREALGKLAKVDEVVEVEVVPAAGRQSITLKVNSKTTVKLLKHQIGKLMRVKANKILLSFEGRTLDDDLNLLAEGVKDKSRLYVIRLS